MYKLLKICLLMVLLGIKGTSVYATDYINEQRPLKRVKVTSSVAGLRTPPSFSLFTFPDEVLIRIFSYLATPEDCRSLGVLRRVSSTISSIAESPGLWKSIAESLPVKSAPLSASDPISWKDKISGHFCLVKAHEAKAKRDRKAIKRWINKAAEAVKAPSPYYACLPEIITSEFLLFCQSTLVFNQLLKEEDVWALEEQFKTTRSQKFINRYSSLIDAYRKARNGQPTHTWNRLTLPSEQHSPEARSYIEGLLAQGNPDAIAYKIHGLGKGLYGYPWKPQQARTFIEELVANNNEVGQVYQVRGYIDGSYGYPQDLEQVRNLIEKYATKDNLKVLQLKANALIYGWAWKIRKEQRTLYNPDPQEAIKLIRTYSLPLHVCSLTLS